MRRRYWEGSPQESVGHQLIESGLHLWDDGHLIRLRIPARLIGVVLFEVIQVKLLRELLGSGERLVDDLAGDVLISVSLWSRSRGH